AWGWWLLDGLSPPRGPRPQAVALRERIDGRPNWKEQVQALDALAVQPASQAARGQRDVEDYPQQPNERLDNSLSQLD
ncbi:GGDEF domain-containing protein, partial [Pseudomonas aeruginosa]